jgi:hypothetical protein
MTKYDVGILKPGDRVRAKGRDGVVVSPHELEWIDHRTRASRKEFQGADIRFDKERWSTYIHAADIEFNSVKAAQAGKVGGV